MVTATAVPTTDQLNGMLQQQTPALISANVIAQQFGVEPQQLIDYCATHGVFVAPVYSGGEYMVDFNNINEEFVRDFTTSLVVTTLEPQVQARVQAIASLRNGAVAATDTEDTDEDPSDVPTTPLQEWKLAKVGKTLRETIANLLTKNDPAGDKGFLQSLSNKDEAGVKLVDDLIKEHYKSSPQARGRFYGELKKYMSQTEANANSTQPATDTEVPAETPKRQPRKKRTEQAA